MSERKSSINIKPAKSTSQQHNTREQELNYVFPEHSHLNETWEGNMDIAQREKEIKRLCKQITGRKMQKNAEPIREGVINLQAHHTMDDLIKLKEDLKDEFKFEVIQMYIHKDEGVSLKDEHGKELEPKQLDPNRVNYHAHLVFDWQDKETGKMIRYARGQMSRLQTVVAESLGMERGERRTMDGKTANERLEPIEFKVKQEAERHKELSAKTNTLQADIVALEQKKNKARDNNRRAEYGYYEVVKQDPRSEHFPLGLAEEADPKSLKLATKAQIREAISIVEERLREYQESSGEIDELLREREQLKKRIEIVRRELREAEADESRLREENRQKGFDIESVEGEIKRIEEELIEVEREYRKHD